MSCNSIVVFIYTNTNFDLNQQLESPDMLWLYTYIPVQWDTLVITQVQGESPVQGKSRDEGNH